MVIVALVMQQSSMELSRRSFLTNTAVGLAGLGALGHGSVRTAAASNQSTPVQGEWPQYRAGPAHSARLTDDTGPTGDIEQAWSTSHDRIHDGVAVIDQTVYVGGKELIAVNAQNGQTRWSFEPAPPEIEDPGEPLIPDVDSPAVLDGTVYASVGFGPYDGGTYDAALIAVDANTGKRRWRFDTDDASSLRMAPVTVTDDTIVTSIPRGYNDRTVTAFTTDGEIRWQTPIDDMFSGALPVTDGRVYVPSAAGVQALDLETGETVWTALPRVKFDPAATPIVSDGTLFVAEEGEPGVTLIALDAATGAEYWRTAYAPDTYPNLRIGSADEKQVYIHVNGIDADVIALDRTDGGERWRAHVEQRDVPTDGFARVGELLYAGASAIDPTDGTIVWERQLPVTGYGWRLSAVTGGQAYLSGAELVVFSGTGHP